MKQKMIYQDMIEKNIDMQSKKFILKWNGSKVPHGAKIGETPIVRKKQGLAHH